VTTFGVLAALWYALAAWLAPAVALPWLWRRAGCAWDDRESRLDYAFAEVAAWAFSPAFLPLAGAIWLLDWTDTWPLT